MLWPSGKRTGNGVGPQLCETLERVCRDAEALIGKEQAQRRVAVTQESLDEKMDVIRGAVTMGKSVRAVTAGEHDTPNSWPCCRRVRFWVALAADTAGSNPQCLIGAHYK